MSLAKAIIIGRLGRDVDLRYTPQGTPVASFSMATSEKRKDRTSGDFKEQTTWFKVTLWGKQAETASQYLHKGGEVCIEGRISLEEWTDRDGKQHSGIAINGTDMTFIGGGQGESRSQPTSNASSKSAEVPDLSDDDPPF